MELINSLTGPEAVAVASTAQPSGPDFSADIIRRMVTLEVYGSELNEHGPDYCEFWALDTNNHRVATARVCGY